MDLDDLLQRYFSSTDLSEVSPDVLASGVERCQVDLGLEKDRGKRFQIKHILVAPCETLSLQMHYHRSEHWVVVSGTAEVTVF